MQAKKTLVIGASTNPERYAYKAVYKLKEYKHPVIALGLKPGEIEGIQIQTEKKPIADLDTVSLYVSAKNQGEYIPYILSLNPKRVVFNPGTENPDFYTQLHQKGIQSLEACTLVLLSIGDY